MLLHIHNPHQILLHLHNHMYRVESSFWNFDALFQPQSHPARDAHDTFFMKEPMYANTVPEEYYEVCICV